MRQGKRQEEIRREAEMLNNLGIIVRKVNKEIISHRIMRFERMEGVRRIV